MYNKKYLKWRVLMARNLMKLYFQKGNADWTLGKIHERFGEPQMGVNRETFIKYCTKYEVPNEELPLYIAAVQPLFEPYRKMAINLEMGLVNPSDVTDPIYQPLVELYKKRAFFKRQAERERKKGRSSGK